MSEGRKVAAEWSDVLGGVYTLGLLAFAGWPWLAKRMSMENLPGFFQVSTALVIGVMVWSNRQQRRQLDSLERRLTDALALDLPSPSDKSARADVVRAALAHGMRRDEK